MIANEGTDQTKDKAYALRLRIEKRRQDHGDQRTQRLQQDLRGEMIMMRKILRRRAADLARLSRPGRWPPEGTLEDRLRGCGRRRRHPVRHPGRQVAADRYRLAQRLRALPSPDGAKNSADRIVAAAKKLGLSKIDYLIITHYHMDHVGGVVDLAKRIPVDTFIDHGPNAEHLPPGRRTIRQICRAARRTCSIRNIWRSSKATSISSPSRGR